MKSLALLVGLMASAAPQAQFHARLSVAPITVAMQRQVAGSGSVQARILGSHLEIYATYRDLKSAATSAELREAQPGLRGRVLRALTVTPTGDGAAGEISGEIDLSPEELAALKSGHLYVQLNSRSAPDGNLRGWLEPGR